MSELLETTAGLAYKLVYEVIHPRDKQELAESIGLVCGLGVIALSGYAAIKVMNTVKIE
jgi:hypothetical protein